MIATKSKPTASRRRRISLQPAFKPIDTTSLARILDREADHLLQSGRHLQAERLAFRAAELREGAR